MPIPLPATRQGSGGVLRPSWSIKVVLARTEITELLILGHELALFGAKDANENAV